MRRWWILGLVILGAAALGQAPSPTSDGQHGTVRPQAPKTEARREDQEAERRIAAGIAEEGSPAAALEHFHQAVQLARHSGSKVSEARALTHAGHAAMSLSELGAAGSFYGQALEAWNQAGFPEERLEALQNMAVFHLTLGEPARAFDALQQAREIDSDHPKVLHLLGMTFLTAENDGLALSYLRRALDLSRTGSDVLLQGRLLADIGSASFHLGEIEQSAAAFEECLRISVEQKSPKHEAYARAGLGRVMGARRRFDQALAELDQAETIFRREGEVYSLSIVLASKALLEREQGDLRKALELSRESIGLIEAQRQEIAGPRARAAWLDAWSDPYELQIDVLWRLAGREPGRGSEAAAFEVSERIRARTLYEGLAIPRGDARPEAVALERQRNEVTFRLRNLESEKLRLSKLSGEEVRSRRGDIDGEIRGLVALEGTLWEQIRRSDPRSALAGLQPLGLPQVQALLDPETAFLVYTLGRERSFVWWIDQGSLTMQELPGRREIEVAAERLQALLMEVPTPHKLRQVNALLARLSELLLRPVADKLPRVRQLAIVPDGALQTLPFAALPRPEADGAAGDPLVASHVTVVLPSPSTLAALRRREAGRRRPDKQIAVIAHPVFSDLPQLERSAKEAHEILALVPSGQGRAILGFDAVPEITKDPDFRSYRYLHFGAHGIVNDKQPELSGIVLSQVTPDGTPRDGLLRFYDVYNLDLPADLVSLSTCRSADGPQIRREGPITMTRSFFYAGASRVLGTLWEVSDKPAAELTAAFYEGVLREGKSPAEALRDAQNAMRSKHPRGWPPHSWAAFVLQGDWR